MTRVSTILTGTLALLTLLSGSVQAQQTYAVDPTSGLRMERYRAPVPTDIPDAITVDTPAARTLHDDGIAVFIDVYPPKGLGPDPLDGHWVITEERESIPGATWLPEVGRGTLQSDAKDYFERNLERLSGADKAAPLVFFCTSDCWQSWNATRRATQLGYTNLHWYPLGSDGWLEDGHTLTRVFPLNFFDDTPDNPATRDSQ